MATALNKIEEGTENMKPDGEVSLVPSKGRSWGGVEPPATEIHTGKPRPPSDKETRSKDADRGTAADGPLDPPAAAQCKQHCCRHWMHPDYLNAQRAFSPVD